MKENKMGVMPIGKLLVQMALPMMISMLVQALYNVVDSIFVAKLGENALTAVSLAFSIQNLMIAVSTGTGVGINALLSMRLGEKKQDDVNKAALNGIFLELCSCVVFVILGLTITQKYFESQTSNPEIIENGVTYLSVCMIFSIGVFGEVTFNRLLQSTGQTFYSMISQLTGAIINIILDPLLIFGLLGFPKLGILGAALATVFGQCVGSCVGLYLNLKKNKEIHFRFKSFKPDLTVIKGIYKVGFPSILLASIGSVMTYFMNLILGSFTTTAIAVFGVYFKLQSFIFMPVFGLNNGMVPIISFNYGARNKARITRTIKLGMIVAVLILTCGTLLFLFIPDVLLSFFNASEDMYRIGIPALRIISIHFPIAALCIVFISVFQALGKGFYSMITSFIRQIVVLLPVAYILSLTQNVNNIWYAFPIAEFASLCISFFFMLRIYRKKIKTLESVSLE